MLLIYSKLTLKGCLILKQVMVCKSYNFLKVYVNLEEREWWLPGQNLDLEVVAEASSLVCLLGGRSRGSTDIKFDPRIRLVSHSFVFPLL